ncbi:MAG TPA: hypothetical protein VFE23_18375 [Usitatibacter sp.]|jgi:hypothetical protein|nr:hypothetical protein [Usitatibacter sp.]
MGAIFRRYPILIALAALAALLALVIAWEISAHVGSGFALSQRPVRRAAPFEAKLLPPPAPVQAEQQYPEFAARPLWTPTRRPAPAAAAPSTYTPGQYVLLGVIVAGNTRTAMLREKSSGKLHRVEAGKQLNGITVAEINPESVTLAQGTDREVLPLQVQKGPGAPAAEARPPGVPVPQAQFGPAPSNPGLHPAPMPVQSAPVHESGPFGPAGGGPVPVPAPPGQPGGPVPANGAGVPQANPFQAGVNPAGAPMTAEELLARRRARRGQQPE